MSTILREPTAPAAGAAAGASPGAAPASGAAPLLSVRGLDKKFGGLHAVKSVSLEVQRGEIVGILGPNGAGKTTLYNLLTGFIPPDAGEVLFEGRSLAGLSPHRIVGMGIARTFQLCRPFVGMSVLENVRVGSLGPRVPAGDLDARARGLLAQVGLAGKEHVAAELLSYGDQRRLEIARALATEPALLLLDEPFAGLGSGEIDELSVLIRRLHAERGLTILLIEHKLREFMKLVQRVVAIDFGEVIATGSPDEIVANDRVIEAYIGRSAPQDEDGSAASVGAATGASTGAPSGSTATRATGAASTASTTFTASAGTAGTSSSTAARPAAAAAPLLELRNLSASYGKALALEDVSLRVGAGELVVVLGPNGAGKSTLLRAVSRAMPSRGTLDFAGRSLHEASAHQVVGRGICHCPEGRRLFPELTVRKNLQLGAFLRDDADAVARDLERVYAMFPVLREREAQLVSTLSGGQQQMVAIGRALMGAPKLLLLDEPSVGIAHRLKMEIFAAIERIRDTGVAILMAEQDAQSALRVADRAYVLEHGHVAREGTPDELNRDDRIRQIYLGVA